VSRPRTRRPASARGGAARAPRSDPERGRRGPGLVRDRAPGPRSRRRRCSRRGTASTPTSRPARPGDRSPRQGRRRSGALEKQPGTQDPSADPAVEALRTLPPARLPQAGQRAARRRRGRDRARRGQRAPPGRDAAGCAIFGASGLAHVEAAGSGPLPGSVRLRAGRDQLGLGATLLASGAGLTGSIVIGPPRRRRPAQRADRGADPRPSGAAAPPLTRAPRLVNPRSQAGASRSSAPGSRSLAHSVSRAPQRSRARPEEAVPCSTRLPGGSRPGPHASRAPRGAAASSSARRGEALPRDGGRLVTTRRSRTRRG